jgi:hypothetical protein
MSDQERFEKFYEKAAKYGGWKEVPADRIAEMFQEVTQPEKTEFQVLKPGWLIRPIDSEITQFIRLQRLKGAAYGLQFGLSLAYVPYPYAPRIKWHLTLKSINPDLFEQPQLIWGDERGLDGGEAFLASPAWGKNAFRMNSSGAGQ